jgi:hypothetical protein
MMMQTGLPSGLQTALQAQMEREVMSGQARTMTREETPTVFGKLMAEVAPPAVPDVAQQAGLAGQIQAMRMKQAQEALMNQAMAQRPQGGVEALNPQVGNFAEGGIVGYAGDDDSYVKNPLARLLRNISLSPPTRGGSAKDAPPSMSPEERERILETLAEAGPMMDIPEVVIAQPSGQRAAQGQGQGQGIPVPRVGVGSLPAAAEMGPPVPTGSERQFEQVLAAYERSRPRDVTPEQGYEAAMQANAQQRRFLQAMGVDPDMLKKQAEEVERRGTERGSYYESQAQAARDKAKRDSLKNFLLGARGRGFGDVMGAGAQAARGADAAAEAQAQRFMELKLQTQDAAVKERMLINRLQFETATGQFDKAMKTKQEIENNRQKFETAGAELRLARTKDLAAEERQRLDREMEARRLEATQRGQDLQYLSSMQRTGGATNPRAIYDTINDNVQKRMDAWTKSREGIISGKDPSVAANKRREFVAEAIREAQALGVAIPPEVAKAFEQGTTGGSTGAANVDLSKFKVTKE